MPMSNYRITKHMRIRMDQRGFRKSDPDIILKYGSRVSHEKFMLTKRNAKEAIRMIKNEMKSDGQKKIRELKRRIGEVERLSGSVLVLVDRRLITIYHHF